MSFFCTFKSCPFPIAPSTIPPPENDSSHPGFNDDYDGGGESDTYTYTHIYIFE